MNKGFYLQVIRDMCPDLTDLFQGQLPCCDYTLCSKPVPEKEGFIIGIIGLSTDMAFNLRADFPGIGKYTWICNDQSVRFQFF